MWIVVKSPMVVAVVVGVVDDMIVMVTVVSLVNMSMVMDLLN